MKENKVLKYCFYLPRDELLFLRQILQNRKFSLLKMQLVLFIEAPATPETLLPPLQLTFSQKPGFLFLISLSRSKVFLSKLASRLKNQLQSGNTEGNNN